MGMTWWAAAAAVLAFLAAAATVFRSSLLILGEDGLSEEASRGEEGAALLLEAVRTPALRHPFSLWIAGVGLKAAAALSAGGAACGLAVSVGGWAGVAAAAGWAAGFLLMAFVLENLAGRKAMQNSRGVLRRWGRACLLAMRAAALPARAVDRIGRVLFRDRYSPEALMDVRFVSEEGILDVIEEGAEHGTIDPTEERMIEGVLRLGEMAVTEGMTPWAEVVFLREGMAYEEVARIAGETGFSRYPVLAAGGEEVVGILTARTLFRKEAVPHWERLLEKPFYVPESMKVSDLFGRFRRMEVHMAIVIDEHGRLCGAITVHDLMEKIVGRLSEGNGPIEAPEWERDGALSVPAAMPVRTLRDDYGIDIPLSDHYETVGGFVMDFLQDVPEGGVTLLAHGYRITVVETDRYRIRRLRLERIGPTGTT
jgi:CBS domain containing-hemolysin-like protein